MDNLDPRTKQVLLSAISQLVSALSEEERKSLFQDIQRGNAPSNAPLDGNIPVSVFKSSLSGLEALTQYLRDVERKKYKDIAELLNRKASTIYNTHANLKKKDPEPSDTSDTSFIIPVTIFADRTYSVLEHIVFHLRTEYDLSLTEISALLDKGYSTVKTVNRRHNIKSKASRDIDGGVR